MSPLVLRALLIHRAYPGSYLRKNIGWGRFETEVESLITCEDDEVFVIYQGELPLSIHLRAPVPMPLEGFQHVKGKVTLTATLVIAPDVDPEHPGAYTRGGLEVSFRPHAEKYRDYEGGKQSSHPKTQSFFSASNLYEDFADDSRKDGYKWEPCRRHEETFQASSLKDPCFDIYYHHRENAKKSSSPKPIPYALIVSMKAPQIKDLYNQVVRAYANVLVPLRAQIQIPIRT